MTLPVQTQAVADERGLLTPTWRRWLAELERRVSSSQNGSLAADIAAIATALGSPDGTVANIPEQANSSGLIVGRNGVQVAGRLGQGTVFVELTNPIETAADLAYDPATSGLTAEDVQAAIDELASSSGGVQSIVAGTNITVDNTDPANPVVSATGGAGAGALAYVTTVAVAGSAATSLAVSGLDLDADGHYVADVYLTNATGSNASVRLFYNADTTNTNYDRQGWGFSGTTNTGGRANDAIINVLNASTISLFRLNIWVAGGRVIADTFGADRTTTALEVRAFLHEWRTIGTNVTGFTLSSTVANAIGVGSFVKLWKMTA